MLNLRDQARQQMPVVPNIPELNEAAIGTWKARMVNEYGSARVFEGLHRQLSKCDLDPSDLDRLASFAEDERRHGVLCGAVVEALGGAVGRTPASCGPISRASRCLRPRGCHLKPHQHLLHERNRGGLFDWR